MKFKIRRIRPLKLYHIEFEDQIEMCTAMLRMQEFYESPKFRNKHFTWDEYIAWFVRKYKKNFDYLTDVWGFNIPGNYAIRFYEEFEELTKLEKNLHSKLKNRLDIAYNNWSWSPAWTDDFYLIATCKNDQKTYINHEVRHALFYLTPAYKKAILEAMKPFETKEFRKMLLEWGYHKCVLEDEIQAYVLTDLSDWYDGPVNTWPHELRVLRKELKKVEKQFIKKGVIHVPKS